MITEVIKLFAVSNSRISLILDPYSLDCIVGCLCFCYRICCAFFESPHFLTTLRNQYPVLTKSGSLPFICDVFDVDDERMIAVASGTLLLPYL